MRNSLIALFTALLATLSASSVALARDPVWYAPSPKALLKSDTATPLFEAQQSYLEAAPTGVGARQAWLTPGGTGENVKIVDIESCDDVQHEDLNTPFYVGNNPVTQCESTDHGTAVLGEMVAKRDDKGVTGIAYGASYGVHAFIEGDLDNVTDAYITGINTAIQGAMSKLVAGDVMVIEQHMLDDAGHYVPVEFWDKISSQLKAASDRGILCIEAAGNGSQNLDDPSFNGAFDLAKHDNGCIMVGAVGPTFAVLGFSNFGSRIDAYGYGDNVTTTGYSDLFNGGPHRGYTASFNGTSSATPIVSAAVALVSSIAKGKGRTLTPAEVRTALRSTRALGTTGLPDVAAMQKFLGLAP